MISTIPTRNSLQAIEIAARFDADDSRNDRKFRKFPVIFPVIRELGTRDRASRRPEETPMTETSNLFVTAQPVCARARLG
jgi:hypothetical protein